MKIQGVPELGNILGVTLEHLDNKKVYINVCPI